MRDMKALAVIPARYASTRFPAKPLALLKGKAVIMWVYDAVVSSGLFERVVVATDDERIFGAVKGNGAEVMMTSQRHVCGTERCEQVLDELEKRGDRYDVVVNVQGDEPLIKREQLQAVLGCFEHEGCQIATLAKPLNNLEDVLSANVVKVAFSGGKALYFSRSAIPFVRSLSMEDALKEGFYHKHIGLYAYLPSVLHKVVRLKRTPLEQAESLEQLRWLENGMEIRVEPTDYDSFGVDTPEDLERINKMITTKKQFIRT